jgi:hypothetical protein
MNYVNDDTNYNKLKQLYYVRTYWGAVPWFRQLVAASHRGGPGSIPGHSMWDLWWTKWH